MQCGLRPTALDSVLSARDPQPELPPESGTSPPRHPHSPCEPSPEGSGLATFNRTGRHAFAARSSSLPGHLGWSTALPTGKDPEDRERGGS
jgi:hypothetical protein